MEAGAQGEHKLSRGYLPALTYSLHYLPDQRFSGVVERCARAARCGAVQQKGRGARVLGGVPALQ